MFRLINVMRYCFNPLWSEVHVNIWTVTSFFTVNNMIITKTKRLMLFTEILVAHCENYTQHLNTHCGHNPGLLNGEAGGI
jgi:hypothetical protein